MDSSEDSPRRNEAVSAVSNSAMPKRTELAVHHSGLAVALAACMMVAGPRLMNVGEAVNGPAGPPPRLRFTRPFLEEVGDSVKVVRVSNAGVPAREFLLASYGIITIFDSLPGMGIVKADMLGNCDALWRHLSGRPIERMCDDEIVALGGANDRAAAYTAARTDGSACTSLLWLTRALKFVEAILSAMLSSPHASLKECVYSAYGLTMRKHHNIVVKGVFAAAVNAAPSRPAFVAKLAPAGASEAAAMKLLARCACDI